ncbi:MAG: hypothetical protein LUH63_21605 [Parabacteroides sp.]|nr:hypothetical protein [Parabacteroides sp.]
MSVKYKLVLRKDLSKDAGKDDKKYYASVNNSGTFSFDNLCESVASISTASRGDVLVVMDGALTVMKSALLRGEIVQFGELGNFQINFGSKGGQHDGRVQGEPDTETAHRLPSKHAVEKQSGKSECRTYRKRDGAIAGRRFGRRGASGRTVAA